MPSLAYAEDSGGKVVRVGWYESAFHTTDSYGRKSGYGYEYQQRIATYTDWEYEYVEGSWPELLAMLIDGDLDLLSDVSYTPERAEKILYSAEPMGSEGYHVFITPDNTEIRPNDLTTLNGKRIGVNQSSIQEQFLVAWVSERGLTPEIVELTEKSPVLFDMLATGQLDALVTLDTYGTSADVVPVVKIGSAESYFGINKGRPDLKRELDAAMSRILEEDRDFNQRLAEQFNRSSTVNSFLTAEELDWLGEHSAIRVGYRDDFLPFCSLDKDAHELTGTLADFLAFAQHCEKNADLDFETHAFATTEEAFDALAAGEIDCLFPVSLSSYDGEQLGATISDPLVSTEMYAAVRTADQQGISADAPMRVAVMSGIPSYLTFLEDHFPDWTPIFCDGVEEGLKMVADGAADCMFVSNYRINYLSELLDRYGLSPLATGEAMNMSFAVRRNDDCLYSILNKAIRLFPTSTANATLTTHSFRNEHVTFAEFLRDNLVYVICAVSIITVIILALLLKGVRSEKRAEEGRQIISEAERDPLTGLYTWNFFLVYANRLYRYDPEHPMDAVVMNIDRFHQINALHGREFGDKVLYELGDEIRRFLETAGGIASRFESDRFDIYCEHRDDWPKQFARFQARLDAIQHNASIHLRMGVKPWQEAMEPIQLFDRARTACNSVRGDYTARVVVYDDAMGEREERDQRLLMDLPRAIENRELEVYYQPKYAIQTEVPTLSSAEALIRWKHPDLGLIPPGEFIDLFEHSGQIGELDRYVWAEASRQIAAWRDEFGHTLPVSVNLSRVDVFDETLQDTLEGLVEHYGLAHGDLKLEVTESAYTENADQLIVVISKLRSRGFEIEMDDFGSGFSSLNMLSSMPIDILKMDMAFIRNMERDERDFRLIELILDIARYLRVPVVAEGVETESQLRLLREAGCDLVQGYYFSKPLPADEFARTILVRAYGTPDADPRR